MKKVIGVLIAVTLLSGVVACATPLDLPWCESMVVYGYEGSDDVTVEGNIMAVFYFKVDFNQALAGQVIGWYTNAQIIDNGDGTWDVVGDQGSATGVNQDMVTYDLFQYKEDMPNVSDPDNPIYLDDLDLQPITADDLPHSEHIGKLTAVNPSLARPATVTRRYMGVNYDVPCLVTQAVVNMWTANPKEIDVGDYVLVSFIDEIPNSTERHIAIVTDKIYDNWSS